MLPHLLMSLMMGRNKLFHRVAMCKEMGRDGMEEDFEDERLKLNFVPLTLPCQSLFL